MATKLRDPRILVLGVGGNVSQGIVKAIRGSQLNCKIYGGCVDIKSAGLYLCDQAILSPLASDETFLDWLIEVCNQHQIAGILSGVEPVLQQLSQNRLRIESSTSAKTIVSSPKQLQVCGDKFQTAQWLKAHGLNSPSTVLSDDEENINCLINSFGYPLLAKPRSGKSSNGIRVINRDEDLNEIAGKAGYVIQQYLGTPEDEYTASTFTDREKRLRGSIIFRRHLQSGTTICAEATSSPEVKEEVQRIAECLAPYGPCNIQLRMTENGPVCFEINLRYSGTTPIRAALGFNDVESGIRNFILDEEIQDLPSITQGLALRYWNEMYLKPSAPTLMDHSKMLAAPNSHVMSIERIGFDK